VTPCMLIEGSHMFPSRGGGGGGDSRGWGGAAGGRMGGGVRDLKWQQQK
jgi:hypothetical protein